MVQPTMFDLVVNLKTTKARWGSPIPQIVASLFLMPRQSLVLAHHQGAPGLLPPPELNPPYRDLAGSSANAHPIACRLSDPGERRIHAVSNAKT